ncbi:type ISP restriction/modification enzyme, partial [Bartonella sp. AA33NXGY]|uniref:type ISP restriction/modification enzyme n=1 Tax=Bartonella sp. AA33NXGY TaxID=3243433 RepID=UPI0035CE8F65
TLGSSGIHIIDPFTGTGTFITRLLQSGLIKPEEMKHKFCHEIHANEIMLLAYYIAAINIETTYHGLMGGGYVPFEGICLTDTFQLYEQEKDLISDLLVDNSTRRSRQKELDIRVIVGNPPYSSGQKNENDNAQNISYPKLDRRIRETYAAQSKASNVNGLYDSYIRAIRWASDRIKDCGVIGFVTNAGFISGYSMNGLRKELNEEFSSIYVFNLRGDIRKNMMSKGRAQEGQNIFGSGSMTGIAVTLFVKNPNVSEPCKIYYHDIGDNLTTKEKLSELKRLDSVDGIKREHGWQMITPDEHGDWLDQRNGDFEKFLALGDKKGSDKKLFENFSRGIQTGRDAWAYNSSRESLAKNMRNMIAFYNSEAERFNNAYAHSDRKMRANAVNDFVNTDAKKISWSSSLKEELIRGKAFKFKDTYITQSLYRPFTQQWLYYNRVFNERVYQMPRIFPLEKAAENKVIQVTGVGASSGFSVLMSRGLPSLDAMEKGQCFPRYVYEDAVSLGAKKGNQVHLFA